MRIRMRAVCVWGGGGRGLRNKTIEMMETKGV